jgi:cellulase
MFHRITRIALALFALVTSTSAHARITNITTSSGVVYPGWDPELALSNNIPAPLAAWSASNIGNIFVAPSYFNTSDIACHFDSTPGTLHINITAGDELKMQWIEWPVSHKGPVLAYLAACEGSCADADKNTLKWVKIGESGWLNGTNTGVEGLAGTWASDVLIAGNAAWMVKVPSSLAGGNYVLRHEIIALHVADQVNGAQAYPQCVNLRVVGTGDGKRLDGGVVASQLYQMRDKGILVDIHGDVRGYDIPGPALWEFSEEVRQPMQKS